MEKYIFRLDSGDEIDLSRLGGKCASLASMAAAGAPTPPGFAITTEAFDAVLAQDGLQAWVARTVEGVDPDDMAAADHAVATIRRAIMAQPVPADVGTELRAAYQALTAKCGFEVPVAVRSSATAEDLSNASFAGQQDTRLWVVGGDAVLDAVRWCWASLFTARAIAYRARNRIPVEGLSMAVAVQKMVRSRVAGVAMTVDPGNGDHSKIVIDASWGIGEMVVSGEVTPDHYVVDKVMLTPVRTTVSDKAEELVADMAAGALVRRPVDEERRMSPCLTPEEIVAVARLAKAAEQHYRTPQDVEWAIDADLPGPDNVALLQSRPETVWSRRPRQAAAPASGAGVGSIVRTLLDQPPQAAPSHSAPPTVLEGPPPPAGGTSTSAAQTTCGRTCFSSPYELAAPPGAEGWERLYPYYLVFQQDLRDSEERKFWFCDSQHWPNVLKPFETIGVEFSIRCLGQYNSRHFLVPRAGGIEYRIHNGYVYMSPVAIPAEEIPARVPEFLRRAGHYYANWDALLENWKRKVFDTIAEMEKLDFTALPEVVPFADIESGLGLDASCDLFSGYDRLIQLCYRSWQYHMEFLNLGYAAYLDFFEFCKRQFPDIPDQGIAAMVQGVDTELFRPDDELKSLAKLALTLGVAAPLRSSGDAEQRLAAVAVTARGEEWLRAWEEAKQPWFNFTCGNGFYGSDEYWLDHPSIPLGYIADYIERLERGDHIDRRVADLVAERDRITGEYRELLAPEAVREFDAKLGLARMVYPYVEDHNFYIEHWTMGVFWRKVRQLSRMLHEAGFWEDPDDLLYLGREEVRQVLFDYANGWAVGSPAAGTAYWPKEVARRQAIVGALATARPEPALNEPPAGITEPFTAMLWGITPDRIAAWLAGPDATAGLTGMAASPGVVEGIARVITSPEQLGTVREGDILVAPVTAPSWGPAFGKIRGTVTDIGGMMSHAAIVCREYNVPAVTGTGTASTLIKTGQRIRVDGSRGVVTVLD
ncbi:PEP/pyruvate-binding domain-containing protein [Streptomyces sp. NPDC001292]|uniref:PEP/pyruvate-binding domain-containing protein n=1 Tax=Streptomyces sp. NPDC001292 TaxID=3364558 RepID=UPI0036A3AD64